MKARWKSAVVLVCLMALKPSALACLNAVELSRKQAVKLISDAEQALAAGDGSLALQLLNAKLGRAAYDVEDERLKTRLERVWAVARMRAGGTGEIADAIDTLREQLRDDPKSAWLKTRLAEALSRTVRGTKEARKLLENLLRRDLIVDAEGFATLARLRKQDGDLAGAEQLLGRCQATARAPLICSAEPVPPQRKTRRHETSDEFEWLIHPNSESQSLPCKKRSLELPAQLESADVMPVLQRIDLSRCKVQGRPQSIPIKLTILPSGNVDPVLPVNPNNAVRCVAKAVAKARFPRFCGDRMTLTYPFVLR